MKTSRTAGVGALVLGLTFVAACGSSKSRYCDGTTACADAALECDTASHACVPRGTVDMTVLVDMTVTCATSGECTVGKSLFCDVSAHGCRPCTATDCKGATPICAASGACVECGMEADCQSKQQICDTSAHACVACLNHADCTTGICDSGKCARGTDIVYVNNADASCAVGDGSLPTKPVCQVNAGIALGKKYVKVAGSATAYNAISVTTAADVVVVGPECGGERQISAGCSSWCGD